MNRAIVRGTVKSFQNNGACVACERKSGVTDSLFVHFYDEFLLGDIEIGDKIEVTGCLKTINKNEHHKKRTYIECDSVFCGGDLNDMSDEQKVEMDGILCKQGSNSVTKNGVELAAFVIAVQDGDQKSHYPNCLCWGEDAKTITRLPIGSRLKIVGRLQSRDYDKDGNSHRTYEISCKHLEVL